MSGRIWVVLSSENNHFLLKDEKMTKFLFVGVVFGFFINAHAASADLHIQVAPDVAALKSMGEKRQTPDELLERVVTHPREKLSILDAVHLLRASRLRDAEGVLNTSVYLHLDKGTYRLREPIYIDGLAGGGPNSSVNILGPKGGGAVLNGSQPIRGFISVTNQAVLNKLSGEGRERVLQAELRSQGVTDFGSHRSIGFGHPRVPVAMELFFRGKPMTVARWPNDAYAKIYTSPILESAYQFIVFHKNLSNWVGEPHVSAFGYWRHYWADETLNVQSVDADSGVVSLFSPGPKYGIKEGQPVFFQNILSELDRPGEWYVDYSSGIVYFWPPEKLDGDDVEVSVLDSLIVIDGAQNVIVSDLAFVNVRGSAVMVDKGSKVRISDSIIRNTGGAGVVIRGLDSGLDRVSIGETGGAGVVLAGGNRANLTPGNLYVKNSKIRHFGRLSRAYQPAVDVSGVGNIVVGNTMSDGPHSAIVFHGNNHLISGNTISRVCLEAGDAGAIYTGRDWAARGTVISNNVIRDIPLNEDRGGVFAIYLDDQASGIKITGNKIYGAYVGVFLGGGRDNVIESNDIFDSRVAAVHLDARGVTWQRSMTDDPAGAFRKKLRDVPYADAPYKEQYPNLANLLDDEPGRPKYNVLRGNVFMGNSAVRVLDEAKGGFSIFEVDK